jgi:hypothetical protein
VFLKKLIFAFCLLAQGAAFALSDGGSFLVVPSAEVLAANAFQVKGTIGYHHFAGKDRHPFVTSFRFGLFNTIDFGVQLGSNVSLDIKDQINEAYGVIPAFAIGARAFVQSPEAYFYSVSKSMRKEQVGEFYAVAEWGSDFWKLLGGVSAFPIMEANSVGPFWGYEQGLGTQKLSIVYEGFFRHGFSHHNMGLSLKPSKYFQISAGATEFYRYFFNEDRDFKFRTKDQNAGSGYRTPGIYMSIAINGGFLKEIQGQKIEMDSLKKQLSIHEAELANLRGRLNDLEDASGNYPLNLQKEFMSIVSGYKSDEINLDDLRSKEQNFIDNGMLAKRFLIRMAKDREQPSENRITAIRMMSYFPDSIFLEPLGSLVADGSNETIAREAALALGTINTPESRETLSAVANQTTGIVRETIIEIMGAL